MFKFVNKYVEIFSLISSYIRNILDFASLPAKPKIFII